MIVFLALDNNNGMMLNNRRQSRDSVMIQKMFEIVGNEDKLWIHSFSQKLLSVDYSKRIAVWDDFLNIADYCDECFVENQHLSEHINKIDTIYVFRWNRDYLSDFKLDIDLSEWNKEIIEEFAGSSHERITLEKYTKENV